MTIEWNSSAGPTLGVEWEVQLVDAHTRMLRQDAGTVLAGLPGLLESGEHPKMRHELMQSTIEVVTGVCGTVAEAKADLALSLKDLQRVAETQGLVIASSGTHAISHWRDGKMAPSQRYAELVQEIQWPSRRLQTMAVHVHVGLRDEHRAMPSMSFSSQVNPWKPRNSCSTSACSSAVRSTLVAIRQWSSSPSSQRLGRGATPFASASSPKSPMTVWVLPMSMVSSTGCEGRPQPRYWRDQ